jgi:hypothetical protein
VQYTSASPGATTTWQVTALTGSLSGGGLYLIGGAAGTGGTTGLPVNASSRSEGQAVPLVCPVSLVHPVPLLPSSPVRGPALETASMEH